MQRLLLSALAGGLLAGTFAAQSSNQQQNSRRQQNPEWQQSSQARNQQRANPNQTNRNQSNRNWQNSQQSSQQRGKQGDVSHMLKLDGWITVAYDTDNDNQVDYYETVYSYDLERARNSSRQRMQSQQGQQGQRQGMRGQRQSFQGQQRGQSQQNQWEQQRQRSQQGMSGQQRDRRSQGQRFQGQNQDPWGQSSGWQSSQNQQQRMQGQQQGQRTQGVSWRDSQQQRSQGFSQARKGGGSQAATYEVEGDVIETKTVKLIDYDQQHLIAKLRTPEGQVAKVDLGPKDDIRNISTGKQIKATGTMGKVDDKAVLMANQIELDGRQVNVQREPDMDLMRFRGTIQSLREMNFRQLDKKHMVADVRLESGRTVQVNLGTPQELQRLNLREGSTITFLADEIQLNGQRALRVQQIRAGGTRVKVDRKEERQRFKTVSQQRNSQQRDSRRNN